MVQIAKKCRELCRDLAVEHYQNSYMQNRPRGAPGLWVSERETQNQDHLALDFDFGFAGFLFGGGISRIFKIIGEF